MWSAVADNGNGMMKQELDNLFTRYYRGTSTELKSEGSGLGMAIAKQIVEAHDGSICASMSQQTPTLQNAAMAVIIFAAVYCAFYALSVKSYHGIVWRRAGSSANLL